jgi:hypothetical protein
MKYFNDYGRCIPMQGMRVFSTEPNNYYRLTQPEISYENILNRCIEFGMAPDSVKTADFKEKADYLLDGLKSDDKYRNLLKSIRIPFVFQNMTGKIDLGINLEEVLLPNLQKSFNADNSQAHFKAILQGNSELQKKISIAPDSRYEEFLIASKNSPVVGWYFPQALQEFDIESQRQQIKFLPQLKNGNICLSGGMDICAAIIGTPNLLISNEFYTPILCMSAYIHKDPRLVLLLKSYGPHMEFWCMTQMLTPDIKQVSEQWTGGITVFEII